MHTSSLASLALVFWSSLATAISLSPEHSVEILAWPQSSTKPQPLVSIAYNSTSAHVVHEASPSFLTTAPADEVVRLGFFREKSSATATAAGSWSGIATVAESLTQSRGKKIQLLLTTDGELYHVGFQTLGADVVAKGAAQWVVEVVPTRPGPRVNLNKPVAVTADGKPAGEEPEKSFLQKYWWAILGVILVQMVLAGPKE